MKRQHIAGIYGSPGDFFGGQTLTVCGWARTMRATSKTFGFIELNDGSCFKSLQVVLERGKLANYRRGRTPERRRGAHACTGELVLTPEAKQPFELKADSIDGRGRVHAGLSAAEKAPHAWSSCARSQHLRPRTNLF